MKLIICGFTNEDELKITKLLSLNSKKYLTICLKSCDEVFDFLEQKNKIDAIIVNVISSEFANFIDDLKINPKYLLLPVIVYKNSEIFHSNTEYKFTITAHSINEIIIEVINLKNALNEIFYSDNKLLSFNQNRSKLALRQEEIIYIETAYNKVKIVTTTKEYQVSKFRLYDFINEVGERFCRCNRGTIVNIKYIKSIYLMTNEILLENGSCIVIGDSYKEEVKSKLSYVS